ncbi:bifunctional diguanylate cyclase/phosphodiesterase [Halomonas sp. 3H]|uniref:putative bifunctional diguanylate cyclase/phosphodiesterase n=1 Tax=Halomonas sp. 3H TaxID=2952527 RepID=UPI0020B840F9|nr:EAL domain-containing protein [Halomonas sp. 3H]
MPITTRHLMLDSLLLLLAASFIIVGLNGLLLGWMELVYSPLHLLLVADGFMAMLLAGAGLMALLAGSSGARLLAGGLLMVLLLHTLAHALLSPIGIMPAGIESRLAILPAVAMLPVAVFLLIGRSGGPWRRLWLSLGSVLAVLGGVAMLPLIPVLRPWFLTRFDPALLVALVVAGLLGVGIMVAALRDERPLQLGRYAVITGLVGVMASSLAWFVLSSQQDEALERQATYLLDNIQFNAEQAMMSRLALMRRMAERLDAGNGELDSQVLQRDLMAYLRDVSSLKAVGLYRPGAEWAWLSGRDAASQRVLVEKVEQASVQEWLRVDIGQPRLMLAAPEAPWMGLLAVAVPSSGHQLLSLVDLSELLSQELQWQLGLYRVVVLRQGETLTELRQSTLAAGEAESAFVHHLMQRRDIGLPGGPMLTLEAYPGSQHDWLLAGLMPVGVASGGLTLSGMLVFSLALAGQLLGRTRALGEARQQLEAQQAVQTLILREEPLADILSAICRMLEQQVPGSFCSIMLVNDKRTALALAAGDSLPEAFREAVATLPIGDGIGACGSAAQLADTVICEDLGEDPRWEGYQGLALSNGLRACWSFPVFGSDGKVLGTLASYLPEPGAPGVASRLLLSKAADLVALAVERHQSRRTLRLLERSVEDSINGVVIADAMQPDLPIIFVNPAFTRICGYTSDEALGRNCRFLQGPDTDAGEVSRLREQLRGESQVHVTLLNYRKDGTPFWNALSISPVRDDRGQVTHFVGMQHDVSEQKAYESRLAHHASHDALTGLINRSRFEERLAQEVALMNHLDARLAVLFVDLDDFKPINDTLGHAVGDDMLREVARRLQASVRPGDTVARMGGDEFVLLMRDISREGQVLSLVEPLMQDIARPYRVDDHELYLTCSVGIALSNPAMNEPRELIQQADMAMYKAKQQGRNAYHWYTHEITEQLGERVALRNELQEAIEARGLELHYQPLIARDGSLAGVEALLRWQHPDRGYVSPEVFIPLAESTGQIIPLSRWVLERACCDMVLLGRQGVGTVRVAVNLSPLQFHRPNFLATLREVLQQTGMPAHLLDLELTEGILMDNTESAIDILHALRGMQIGVSIDDFGTGFSSLSYLRDLPISKVKIDRSFIAEITSNPHDAAIVQGMISMAGHLGLEVVAEGVETPAQRQQLDAWGCDIYQGFLLARPMPLSALSRWITESTEPSG